jgi:hypothetical protein
MIIDTLLASLPPNTSKKIKEVQSTQYFCTVSLLGLKTPSATSVTSMSRIAKFFQRRVRGKTTYKKRKQVHGKSAVCVGMIVQHLVGGDGRVWGSSVMNGRSPGIVRHAVLIRERFTTFEESEWTKKTETCSTE